MKKLFLLLSVFYLLQSAYSKDMLLHSPDGNLKVSIINDQGDVYYNVNYKDKLLLENSPLGLVTSLSDFSKNLTLVSQKDSTIKEQYTQTRIKKGVISYEANESVLVFENKNKEKIQITFRLSNNDIAFKYRLDGGKRGGCTVLKEITGFKFPKFSTTFITPQATPMIGWERTKPSYEEGYAPDQPVGTRSHYGLGFTFPGLFHVGADGWVLVSETGVTGAFCGSRLGEPTKDGLYTIAYPEPGENNGIADSKPSISLPGETPWRTITVGDNLAPIVETTVPFDVVKPLYEPSIDYKMGRATWSWLMWQDASMNEKDQRTFIDLAGTLSYEFILMDAGWEKNLGHEKVKELVDYAKSKNVSVYLWYNSNGYSNDAPQDPKNKMNDPIIRKAEMKWMQKVGVKGIKVDFFGGDKQETMRLYEAILSDANEYGIGVIFHGCTLPRGWERMYPNFMASEAVLASENLIFSQQANDDEAYSATLHPFIRNSVGSMDFGPVLLNKRHNRDNDGGNVRKTTETFQLAMAVLFQSPVQNFGITPNNLTECAPHVIDFMKNVPTTWDEIKFIDGYPGKYCVLARRHGDKWYVAAINAEKETKKIKVKLPMLSGKKISFYQDKPDATTGLKQVAVSRTGEVNLTLVSGGAAILVD
jgi:hypothetical protein